MAVDILDVSTQTISSSTASDTLYTVIDLGNGFSIYQKGKTKAVRINTGMSKTYTHCLNTGPCKISTSLSKNSLGEFICFDIL